MGVVLLLGAFAMVHYYAPTSAQGRAPQRPRTAGSRTDGAGREQLRQDQAMPAVVLNRYRNSIGYIYGVYQVGFPNQGRSRGRGTGFLIGNRLLATNRHVAEPWYGDAEAQRHQGATGLLESLVGLLSRLADACAPPRVGSNFRLAVLRAEDSNLVRGLAVLPLAKSPGAPGQLVTVIGYPMGIAGMVAKSPTGIYERLAYRHNDISAASELAALSLIRPSTTCGHLGDVVGDKLIYDAPTAHGGSGGPVFNTRGEVIGVNSAFMDGFAGGTLGVSVDSLRPLLQEAQKQKQNCSAVVPPY